MVYFCILRNFNIKVTPDLTCLGVVKVNVITRSKSNEVWVGRTYLGTEANLAAGEFPRTHRTILNTQGKGEGIKQRSYQCN